MTTNHCEWWLSWFWLTGYDVLCWPFLFSKWAKFPLLGSNRCVASRNPQFGESTLLIHYLDNKHTFIQLLLDANVYKIVMEDSVWILQLIHQGSELFSFEQDGFRAHVLCNQLISFLKSKDVHKGIYADVIHRVRWTRLVSKLYWEQEMYLPFSQAIVGPNMQCSWVTVAVKNYPGRKGARPGSGIRISFSVSDIERPEQWWSQWIRAEIVHHSSFPVVNWRYFDEAPVFAGLGSCYSSSSGSSGSNSGGSVVWAGLGRGRGTNDREAAFWLHLVLNR